jgi:hypothetical protein
MRGLANGKKTRRRWPVMAVHGTREENGISERKGGGEAGRANMLRMALVVMASVAAASQTMTWARRLSMKRENFVQVRLQTALVSRYTRTRATRPALARRSGEPLTSTCSRCGGKMQPKTHGLALEICFPILKRCNV